ncbi:hypothetical protein [Bulleidia sp. HCP3S3_F2]|nr:hypothetical protein [Erysipelotrichaceae bacterium]
MTAIQDSFINNILVVFWGALWQIVIIIGASTLVYTPFVIASNKQEEA